MTYERSAIRKWFFMGGDTCPLTGVRLNTTKVPLSLPCILTARCREDANFVTVLFASHHNTPSVIHMTDLLNRKPEASISRIVRL